MNFLWMKDVKRGFGRFLTAGLIVLALVAGTGFLGYLVGRSYGPAQPQAAPAPRALCVPANASTAEAVARRNIVWRVWNGDIAAVPDGPERSIAAALGLLLSHEANADSRNAGMRIFLQKSIAYFSAEEISEIQTLMGTGAPGQIAEALRRISAADGDASDLIRAILADRERVARFTENRLPIPLETMPDGSTP